MQRLTQFLPIQPKDDSSQKCSLVTSNEFWRLREVLGSGKSADAKTTAVGLRICLPLTWSVFIKREGTIMIMDAKGSVEYSFIVYLYFSK